MSGSGPESPSSAPDDPRHGPEDPAPDPDPLRVGQEVALLDLRQQDYNFHTAVIRKPQTARGRWPVQLHAGGKSITVKLANLQRFPTVMRAPAKFVHDIPSPAFLQVFMAPPPQGYPEEARLWYLLRTALKDSPRGPPTANRRPPTPAIHQPTTANPRQPPPTANRQPPPTANRQAPIANL